MDNSNISQALIHGNLESNRVLPHLTDLQQNKYVFTTDFGLEVLPKEPGVIIIRGPRQYGKSTWLEDQALKRLIDAGELRDVLVITAGSKASDLRHGVERLPGRKGKLKKSNFIFTPKCV